MPFRGGTKRTEPGSAQIADQVSRSSFAGLLTLRLFPTKRCVISSLPRYRPLASVSPGLPLPLCSDWPLPYKIWRGCISLQYELHTLQTDSGLILILQSCMQLGGQLHMDSQLIQSPFIHCYYFEMHAICPVCELPSCVYLLGMNGFECITKHVAKCDVTARDGAP